MKLYHIQQAFIEALSFLSSHLFIATAGAAALIHSTWSLATAFNGNEPAFSLAWVGWMLPALLLAFSIDVGQIATSAQIARGERTPWKYATFASFAVFTYFLQWLYLANHLPLIAFGPGVNPSVIPFATGVRDIELWLLPGLLPMSTLLYTFSYGKVAKQRKDTMTIRQTTQTEVKVERSAAHELSTVDAPRIVAGAKSANAVYDATCEVCGWTNSYDSPRGAINGRVAHNRHHHSTIISSNGHNKQE